MTVTQAPTTTPPVSPPHIRRWIRRRQVASNNRVDPATIYSVLLAALMAAALFGQPIIAVVWPATPPTADGLPTMVFVSTGLVMVAFFGVLRQLGPLAISRCDATWLLPAPVSRRMLLSPALFLVVATASVLGGMTGLAVTGRMADRPVQVVTVLAGIAAGSALAILVALVALRCQRRPAFAPVLDVMGGAVGIVLIVVAASTRVAGSHVLPITALPPALTRLAPAGAALALALVAVAVATLQRQLDRWPTYQIAEASMNAGVYADAVYAIEPAFLTEQSTRRYWRRRTRITTTRLFRSTWLPPLVAQDLVIIRRKARRLWWLAGTAAAPTVLADSPSWLLIGLVLIGALAAAGFTSESTHNDASNPAMLRLLGLSGRGVTTQRLVLPTFIAAVWCAVALGGLQVAGALDGPWWALGMVSGPAVAVAAFHRAKASVANIGNILIDTPLGAFPSGMLLWLGNGVDVLALLTLPVSIGLASARVPDSLGWHWVLAQAAASALGYLLLVRRSATQNNRL